MCNCKTHVLNKKKQTLLFVFMGFELSYQGDYYSQAHLDQKSFLGRPSAVNNVP